MKLIEPPLGIIEFPRNLNASQRAELIAYFRAMGKAIGALPLVVYPRLEFDGLGIA